MISKKTKFFSAKSTIKWYINPINCNMCYKLPIKTSLKIKRGFWFN